jgi:hypothetical protein
MIEQRRAERDSLLSYASKVRYLELSKTHRYPHPHCHTSSAGASNRWGFMIARAGADRMTARARWSPAKAPKRQNREIPALPASAVSHSGSR